MYIALDPIGDGMIAAQLLVRLNSQLKAWYFGQNYTASDNTRQPIVPLVLKRYAKRLNLPS